MATTPTIAPATITPGSGTSLNAYSSLSSQDFMKIMLSELSKQDPLKPNDTSTLLQQLSTLRSIQSDLDLQNRLRAVVSQNELSTAGSLLGKTVSGLTEEFDRAVGTVNSVIKTSDGPILVLTDGTRIPFKNVDQFLETPPADSEGPAATP